MLSDRSLQAILKQHREDWLPIGTTDGEQTHWLPIFNIETAGESIRHFGILKSGQWISGQLNNTQAARVGWMVPFLPLLERAHSEVVTLVADGVHRTGLPEVVRTTFPFDTLVEFTLTELEGYWPNLAKGWIETGYPPNDTIAAAIPNHPAIVAWRRERFHRIHNPPSIQPANSPQEPTQD